VIVATVDAHKGVGKYCSKWFRDRSPSRNCRCCWRSAR
jgi:hypothetical protein